MRVSISSTPAQSQQTKQRLADPEDSLSYELGKAVQELPPLYTRFLAASISLLAFGMLAWAYFSKIDEVAVAQGELIPSTQVRPVRTTSIGTIKDIRVQEGQAVKKGEPLVEIEPDRTKVVQEEVTRLENSVKLIQEDLARLEAERAGRTSTGTVVQDQLLAARFREFDSKRAAAQAEANRQIATINESQVRLVRLQENLVNAQTNLSNANELLRNAQVQEKSLRDLLGSGAVPRLEYIKAQAQVTSASDQVTNAQDKVISIDREIAGQQEKIRQAEQAYQAALNTANGVGSQRQSEVLTQLTKRQEEMTSVKGQLEQAKRQKEESTVDSPVDGIIYSMKATRGPVQAGEELLSILPKGEDVILEVKVLNRDIGFIKEGMRAKVKMATFPFQEYGIVEGEVINVSPNAIVEKDVGLVFPTRVKLKKSAINVRGREVELTPGMAATAELVTRQKSILDFLIEPVTRRFSEAFSVR
jgi:HlyD family secretion protein